MLDRAVLFFYVLLGNLISFSFCRMTFSSSDKAFGYSCVKILVASIGVDLIASVIFLVAQFCTISSLFIILGVVISTLPQKSRIGLMYLLKVGVNIFPEHPHLPLLSFSKFPSSSVLFLLLYLHSSSMEIYCPMKLLGTYWHLFSEGLCY